MDKKIDKRKSIGEVANEIGVQSYVIRFWETKFPNQIKPQLGNGGRRYYFERDVALLKKIKHLLYEDGYTIGGLQKLFTKKRRVYPNLKLLNEAVNAIPEEAPAEQNKVEINALPPQQTLPTNQLTPIIERIENNLQRLQKLISEL